MQHYDTVTFTIHSWPYNNSILQSNKLWNACTNKWGEGETVPRNMMGGKITRIREKIKVIFESESLLDDLTLPLRYDLTEDGDLVMILSDQNSDYHFTCQIENRNYGEEMVKISCLEMRG